MRPEKPPIPSQEEEPLELARFRREWLAELRSRKASTTSGIHAPVALDDANAEFSEKKPSKTVNSDPGLIPAVMKKIKEDQSSRSYKEASSSNYVPSAARAQVPLSPGVESAVNIYRRAVEHETRGELDDALVLYRRAFRLEPHVDRIYHQEELISSILAAQREPLKQKAATNASTDDELAAKVHHALTIKHRGDMAAVRVTGTLASLLETFPKDLSFEPEIEEEPVHLQKIPDELLILIIRRLDWTSIERFALINRKARVISLDSAIWREIVLGTYNPPQVVDIDDMTPVLERCLYDYRRVYIEHPRVRLDGVYIATCHYVRPGLSENHWVNVTHMITYHRYLRFFPNGQVLSLLTNEEHTPQQVIPLLKPNLRMTGFYIGTWSLVGTTIELSNLLDASGRFQLSPDHHHTHGPASENRRNRYAFSMTLSLVSRPLGRWNKMHIEAYNSVHLETGDVNPVALKQERPFWFSKVRSY